MREPFCKLYIFDMDGTILDTLQDLTNSVNHALTEVGLPVRNPDEIRRFVGNGIPKLIERSVAASLADILALAGREPGDSSDFVKQENTSGTEESALQRQVYELFIPHYAEHCADCTHPYPGILDVLASLKAADCRLAVVSNKADFAVKELCEHYFPEMFDLSIGDQEGIRRKPYPDSVEKVMKDLGVPKENTVYLGDSEVDIQTAKNAGIPCVSVDWGFKTRKFLTEAGASVIISDPREILAVLPMQKPATGSLLSEEGTGFRK